MSRNLDNDLVARTSKIKGYDGTFFLVRIGSNNSRVASLEPPRGEGFLVQTSDLHEIQGSLTFLDRVSNEMSEQRWFPQASYDDLPYGLPQLKPAVLACEDKVYCCVRGCEKVLVAPRRDREGEPCPDHGIRTHRSGTYTYLPSEAERNIVGDRELFKKLNSHPFKFESRCHNESSEDAVSASVFLSLKEAGLLHQIVFWITGQRVEEKDVTLYLWGLNTDTLQPWDYLIAARNRFERGLPSGRPFSEPDIALVTKEHIIILEAKLTSPNSYVAPGEGRKSPISLTHAEVLARYDTSDLFMNKQTVNVEKAQTRPVPQQLYRYWQIGEWMRFMADIPQFWLVNLTRWGHEVQAQDDFRDLLLERDRERFQVLHWETIYAMTTPYRQQMPRLRTYMENKSVGLKQAFQLGRKWIN